VAIYRQTDRQGLWLGWLGTEPVGCIAGVCYSVAYGFIGLFLVVPQQRGRGYGVRLWRHALEHLSDLPCIGLEAAPDRIDDYQGWGFAPASPTTRWRRGPLTAAPTPLPAPSHDRPPARSPLAEACAEQSSADVIPAADAIPTSLLPAAGPACSATELPLPVSSVPVISPAWCLLEGRSIPDAAVQRFDATREPSPRPHFLHQWLRHPAGTVLALLDRSGVCRGFGRIRPCLLREGEGWRLGPLVADEPAVAFALLQGLLQRHPGVVLIDAPAANPEAAPLLQGLGFTPVSRTLRMYRGVLPSVRLADVYGLACLELG
ncbi:MAG: GNAT family N-acetyltransferase, partial [Cyanobium sp.]